ncbi:MAG: histidine phosphatase family protein [Meiothermus sp.]
MLELWLVRHGETPWNREGRLCGWSDPPLTPWGRQQALALAPWLAQTAFDGVFSSDLQRAIQTARLAHAKPPQLQPALRELNFGALEGLRWAELPEEHQAALLNFEGFQAPQGESTEQFRERVYGFFEGSSPGRYLVFTHGGVLRLVLRDLGQEGFLPPCAAVGLDWSRRRVLFVREPEAAG